MAYIGQARGRNENIRTSMNTETPGPQNGHVASLHLHPLKAGDPLQSVEVIEVIEARGILDEPRYFGRLSRKTGQLSKRQVTLIEREQIGQHAGALGLSSIPPGAVRSNIETLGINLVALIGFEIEIGEAVLSLYAPRDPCSKMDAICQGLRELMTENRQGVLATVVQSGKIRIGDLVKVRKTRPEASAGIS